MPVPIPPPTTAPIAASFVWPPMILPRIAPPATLPPMIPAVLPPEPASLVREPDIAALSPTGVVTLVKESATEPPFSEIFSPLVAGSTAVTRPWTVLPAGIATWSPTMIAEVVVPLIGSPTWLVAELIGEARVMWTSVPLGTVRRATRGAGAGARGGVVELAAGGVVAEAPASAAGGTCC
jgi:hypothetical protein